MGGLRASLDRVRRLNESAVAARRDFMYQEIAAILGPRASANIANSALPCAPVLSESTFRSSSLTRRLRRLLNRADREGTAPTS